MPNELLRTTQWKCTKITVYTRFLLILFLTTEGYTRYSTCNIATAFERFALGFACSPPMKRSEWRSNVAPSFCLWLEPSRTSQDGRKNMRKIENYLRLRMLSWSTGGWDQHLIQSAQVQHSYIDQSVFKTNRETVRGEKAVQNRVASISVSVTEVFISRRVSVQNQVMGM